MKKNIKTLVCDVCEVTPKNIINKLAVRKCAVCERDFCADLVHNGDEYSTTQHMRKGYGNEPAMANFVCSECWKLSESFGYKSGTTRLPTGNIDMRASGSTTAINMAEYREMVESKAKQLSEDCLIDLLKAVRQGKQVVLETNEVFAKMDSAIKKDKEALLVKKKKELFGDK